MKQIDQKIKINLSSAKTQTNVFFDWIITAGKIIIIITELIAFGALAYRFILDRQIVDMHDEISRKLALLNSESSREKEYRSIQARLAVIKQLNAETSLRLSTVNQMYEQVKKKNLILENFSLKKNIVSLSARASSVQNIASFVNDLKKIDSVLSISVVTVSNSDNGIDFQASATIKSNETDTSSQ